MKSSNMLITVLVMCVCAVMLAGIAGCSSGASSSASAVSGSSEAADASAQAGSDASQAEGASAAASSEAQPAEGSADSSGQQAQALADSKQAAIETAISLGNQVFEGTVHVASAEEVLELQGRSDIDPAMASGGGTYAVLVFDVPTKVTGMSGDGSGERTETASMLGVAEYTKYDSFVVEYGDLGVWKPLDGQRVTVAAEARDIMFPSDVRLPIGEPTASVAKVLS